MALTVVQAEALATAIDRVGIPRAMQLLRDEAEARLFATEAVANQALADAATAQAAAELAEAHHGAILPVADLAALGAVDVTSLVTGVACYVRDATIRDWYVLDKLGAWTADGVDAIAAAGAAGYWVSERHGRWEDQQVGVLQAGGVSALKQEAYRDTVFQMVFFQHNQDDALSFSWQMPHRWLYTTDVHPHIHVVPMVAPAADQIALFEGKYVWAVLGDEIPATAGWTPFSAPFTVKPADAFKNIIHPLGSIAPPATARESTFLLMRVTRVGTNVGDTYDTNKVGGTVAANLGVLGSDLHYRIGMAGSQLETPSP